MKQHILPRFYLNGFLDPTAPRGQEPYVWVYSRERRSWKKRAPKNVAAGSGIYSFEDLHGQQRFEVERTLSKVESGVASVLREKVARRVHLDEEARGCIALFVALMMTRVPRFQDMINRTIQQWGLITLDMLKSHPEALEALKGRIEAATGKPLPVDLMPEDLDPSHFVVSASQSLLLQCMLGPALEVADIITQMGWAVMTARDDDCFITSDAPACLLNPRSKGPFHGHGLGWRGVEVTLPLSSRSALMATWEWTHPMYVEVERATVLRINKRTAAHSRDLIVAPRRSFPGDGILSRLA